MTSLIEMSAYKIEILGLRSDPDYSGFKSTSVKLTYSDLRLVLYRPSKFVE